MTPISLITPSYAGDFEACRLLCETMDAYVTGYDRHYVVVSAEDLPLFSTLAGPRRVVLDEASVLPMRLFKMPFALKGKTYRWAPGIPPIRGWHVQQLLKFAMALAQPNARVMFIDSDNCFCRPFDIQDFAGGRVPLQLDRGQVVAGPNDHAGWLENAHALLGLESPQLPADDYIGQMIVWDVEIVRSILARIEDVAGVPWWVAMCRKRRFSEYMIYGAAVASDPDWLAQHVVVEDGPCLSYWSGPALDAAGFAKFIGAMRPHECAIGVQSFTGTPIELIRRAALANRMVAA